MVRRRRAGRFGGDLGIIPLQPGFSPETPIIRISGKVGLLSATQSCTFWWQKLFLRIPPCTFFRKKYQKPADGSAIESESLLSRLPAFSRTAKIPDRRIFRIPFAAEKERPRLRAPGTGVRKGSVFRVRSARSRGCSRENGLRMVLGTFCHQTVPIYLFRKRKQEAQHSVITEQHSCITDQHKWHVF